MKESENTIANKKILRQEVFSIISQSRINNPMYGKSINVTTVPIRPEFMLAIATGEIAYKKLAATRSQLCEVSLEKSLKPVSYTHLTLPTKA